ncbi:hypothetical protein ANO14919_141140 [Xylariales sp. No.14919]|nr:hypothetical protein ANO14919_141140 [Xylariales sp. No.14919]
MAVSPCSLVPFLRNAFHLRQGAALALRKQDSGIRQIDCIRPSIVQCGLNTALRGTRYGSR